MRQHSFTERITTMTLAATSLPHRNSRVRVHQRGGPEPVRIAVEPAPRPSRSSSRSWASPCSRAATAASTLTNDGTELLGYARQVIEQADMLEARYASTAALTRTAAGRVHAALRVQRAGVRRTWSEQCEGDEYDFILRESGHGRDHRRRAHVPQRGGRALHRRLQPRACCRRPSTMPTLAYFPAVRRARARVRGRAPPAGRPRSC